MAVTYLNYPFDEEIFAMYMAEAPDPVKTELIKSGAMVEDAQIASLVANGSDLYTVPFYNPLGGDEVNYDGATDIATTETSGSAMTGVVYGRAIGWSENAFVSNLNPATNPMAYIASKVSDHRQKARNKRVIGMLGGLAGVTAIKNHVIAKDEAIAETTLGDAAVQALGDNADRLTMAYMHSSVANKLANLEILKYAVYTDAEGIERQNRRIAYVNGLLVLVDDNAPKTAGASGKPDTYTTYLLGEGFLRHADAPQDVPAEVTRDPKMNGGMNYLWTRYRETIHPNGFSFVKPKSGYTASPTDAQLAAAANWSLVYDEKTVPFVAVTAQV